MTLRKFDKNDVIKNTLKAYPKVGFFIYDSKIYRNNNRIEEGQFSTDVVGADGGLSLFEYNIDRSGSTEFTGSSEESLNFTGPNPPIVPYVIKSSSRQYLKSTNRANEITVDIDSDTLVYSGPMAEVKKAYSIASEGEVLTGSTYSLTSNISRTFMSVAGETGSFSSVSSGDKTHYYPVNRKYYSLKNILNYYGPRSVHYLTHYSASITGEWNKDNQSINMIEIPKIFYGQSIKAGSMSLKFYYTGSLAGELQDVKFNGELIQVGPEGSVGSGSVAGVALYEEGIVLLTGSWGLTEPISLSSGSSDVSGSWLYFGAGANDGVRQETGNVSGSFASASFSLSFQGETETQVLTMYCHARKGEVNYSNNPTFVEFGQEKVKTTTSNLYIENNNLTIKNTTQSNYSDYSASFTKQVYVSRVGVYDENKKLIGIATLANPVLKREDQDLSFKIKMDF